VARIADTFFRLAGNQPDKTAIWCEGQAMTYGQLAGLVREWSSLMASGGVARGDHVGVLLPNGIEFVALMLVAADLGSVLLPLNTSLPASAIHRAFLAADVRHVVGTADTLGDLRAAALSFSFVEGVWASVQGEAPGAILLDCRQPGNVATSATSGGNAQEDDPFILTMTSGSTGDPKPIILTQRTKFNRAAAAMELYGVTAADRVLAATPLYHSLAERLVLIPLLAGGTSVVMARFSPSEWLRCVHEQSVSFTIAVSSQLRQIAEHLTDAGGKMAATLRCVVSSSALLEPQVKAELLARLHCDFHECYGTSEIAIASDLDAEAARTKLHSVGRAAPGVDIRILRDSGEIAPPDEPGEIVCKTPMIFGGYFKRPDLTREAMWGEYFRTGDVGRLDEDGFLYYLGRKKDIIVTGGINVYPADIESAITELSAVVECAAFPFPDHRLGEIVAVALVPKQPGAFDLRALRIHCARRLADFQQPRKYFVVESLPKNSMGKLVKHELIRQLVTVPPAAGERNER